MPSVDDSLIKSVPDFVAFVRRDGQVLKEIGGTRLALRAAGSLSGRKLSDVWPEEVTGPLLMQIRRVLHDRGTAQASFVLDGVSYEASIAAHGRDRALLIIRDRSSGAPADAGDGVRGGQRHSQEGRALFERLSQATVDARLRESDLAVGLIHVRGLAELGRALDFDVVDRVTSGLVQRMEQLLCEGGRGFAGRLTENTLLVVVEHREAPGSLRDFVARLIDSLRSPVGVGDATFSVEPAAGFASLHSDGIDARHLLENARAALLDARRGRGDGFCFYSDSLKVRSLTRLDIKRELHDAIEADALALHYVGRHDLRSGQCLAVQAYLHWPHPIRGEVQASEFLPVAENTGLALSLSRWALERLCSEVNRLYPDLDPGVAISFSPLRSHWTSGALGQDVEALLAAAGGRPIELRIAESSLASLADAGGVLRPLAERRINLVVDELGRGASSFPRLARLPIRGLQLDRTLGLSAPADPVARRAAAAVIATACALDLIPIAAGIDSGEHRDLLSSLGCLQGSGDAFGALGFGRNAPASHSRNEPSRSAVG